MKDLLRNLAIIYLPGTVLLMVSGVGLTWIGYRQPGLVVFGAGSGMFLLLIVILSRDDRSLS